MKRSVPFYLVAAVATLLLAVSPTAESRTWTDAKTGRTLEGEFNKVDGENVVIIRKNGSSVKVPLAMLSEADKTFVTETQAAAEATAAATPVEGSDKWETSLEKVEERAAAENKPILLDFTGSDWCGYCIKLKDNVFDKKEFKAFAKKNLVLMEVDFPRGGLSSRLEKQNDELKKKYGVTGFPTIIVLNKDGEQIGKLGGYGGDSPEEYIEKLEKIIAKG